MVQVTASPASAAAAAASCRSKQAYIKLNCFCRSEQDQDDSKLMRQSVTQNKAAVLLGPVWRNAGFP